MKKEEIIAKIQSLNNELQDLESQLEDIEEHPDTNLSEIGDKMVKYKYYIADAEHGEFIINIHGYHVQYNALWLNCDFCNKKGFSNNGDINYELYKFIQITEQEYNILLAKIKDYSLTAKSVNDMFVRLRN